MKTEQIAKMAREYADDFLNRADNIFEWNCRYNGFEAGYEACNSEWQEKVQNVKNYLEFEVHSDIADKVIKILIGEK